MPKKFLTLFPEAENIHLIKDVGMIPYALHRYLDYEGFLACYPSEKGYNYLDSEVKGLRLIFIKKVTGNITIDGLLFLLFNSRKFDVLQVYHFYGRPIGWTFFFKLLNLGRKVQTYIKLDANLNLINTRFKSFRQKVLLFMARRADLISAETKYIVDKLNKNWPLKIAYIPNGIEIPSDDKLVRYEEKSDEIITVGRISDPGKAVPVLCEAFRMYVERRSDTNVKLKIVGPIDTAFQEYIDCFFNLHPGLSGKVIFVGEVNDRKMLANYYANAKIFVMTSLSEGFAFVYLEALKYGCYILSTDLPVAWDVTDNEQYGRIFPINDTEKLAQLIFDSMDNEALLREKCIPSQEFLRNHFDWEKIAKKIHQSLNHK